VDIEGHKAFLDIKLSRQDNRVDLDRRVEAETAVEMSRGMREAFRKLRVGRARHDEDTFRFHQSDFQ
jgi:hypothetical protein